jgi:flagellar motor switch protein FliM
MRDGPERLLDAAGISVDRMPMLHVIFDRMVAQCSEGLRHLTANPAFFAVDAIATERLGDILDSRESGVVLAVFYIKAWDARILIGLDHQFVFAMVEALFGGDGSEAALSEQRSLSNVEMRVAQKAFDQAAKALQTAFASVGEAIFTFERIETRADFAVIAPRNNFAFLTKVNFRILDRGGQMFVIMPQAALTPIRQSLTRNISNESSVRDPRWSRQIQNEISRTEVSVRAVIEERQFTLDDIASLKVGQILELQATTQTRVKLESNDQPLFWCLLGQGDGFYTVRVDEFVDNEQEFIDDILQL